MLLAIDIGNTNISLGLFKGRQLLRRYSIPTRSQNYFSYLQKIAERRKIDCAVICSVVPRSTTIIARCLKKLLSCRAYIIGKDIKAPIMNLYRKPQEVGQDRLVSAYAGLVLYGAPLIVVDLGTAVTFDVIPKNRAYLGGMILPGLEISLDALSERTALLPRVKLNRPKEFIGRDTKGSVLSGIVYGFAKAVDGLTKEIKSKIGKNAKVIGTGGNISLIKEYCKIFDIIDSDLTLKGLNILGTFLKVTGSASITN